MALSRVEGFEGLFVGGLWALRRSDSLRERSITHVLSLIGFNPLSMKDFKEVPWKVYGREFEHLVIDVDDMDDSDLLVEMPRIVRFIAQGLHAHREHDRDEDGQTEQHTGRPETAEGSQTSSQAGGVFVHCAAGKSRSVTAVIAYLLHARPRLFDPNTTVSPAQPRTRREAAPLAVQNALEHIRLTRPMADPNPGFMEQLALWWEMGCPAHPRSPRTSRGDGEQTKTDAEAEDADNPVRKHPLYQKWAYQKEVQLHTAVGQAPSHLQFQDELSPAPALPQAQTTSPPAAGGSSASTKVTTLKCKKCRKNLASTPYLIPHTSPQQQNKNKSNTGSKNALTKGGTECQHHFIEPLSWMRPELSKSQLNGRLTCPNEKCGAGVGRYDWKGFGCTCGEWVVPGFSLQRSRVDELVAPGGGSGAYGGGNGDGGGGGGGGGLGIRLPPGMVRGQGHL